MWIWLCVMRFWLTSLPSVLLFKIDWFCACKKHFLSWCRVGCLISQHRLHFTSCFQLYIMLLLVVVWVVFQHENISFKKNVRRCLLHILHVSWNPAPETPHRKLVYKAYTTAERIHALHWVKCACYSLKVHAYCSMISPKDRYRPSHFKGVFTFFVRWNGFILIWPK